MKDLTDYTSSIQGKYGSVLARHNAKDKLLKKLTDEEIKKVISGIHVKANAKYHSWSTIMNETNSVEEILKVLIKEYVDNRTVFDRTVRKLSEAIGLSIYEVRDNFVQWVIDITNSLFYPHSK